MNRPLRGLLCLLSVSACTSTSERSDSGRTVRDSAGVSIVEHSAAYMAALPVWTIDSLPIQELRGDATDTQFANILDAVQRGDGGFYVADQQQRSITSFAAGGAFERVVSRPGRGPGEVGFVSRLQLLEGDSLAFVDANNRRVSVFGPDGRFTRQVLFPRFEDGTTARVIASMADGRLLGSLRRPWVEAPELRGSVYRTTYAIVAFHVAPATPTDSVAPTAQIDTIAVVPDGEAYRATTTEGGETRADEYPIRFGRSTIVASDGHRILVATNETPEIVEYGARGQVRRIRSERVARPVTEEDRARLEGSVLEGVETSARPADVKAELQRMVKGWRYAATHTHAWRLLIGADGSVWTEDPWILEDDPRQYFVYDSTGSARARVVLPPRVRPLRVSMREVLGVWKDSDGVPHVRRWRIVERPGRVGARAPAKRGAPS